MVKRKQILVIGNNDNGCTPEIEKLAYEVGTEVAKSNFVLITGGLGGVMRAACHGAQDAGGITVGIIPQNDSSLANEFCDIVIPSGLGLMRDWCYSSWWRFWNIIRNMCCIHVQKTYCCVKKFWWNCGKIC